MIPQRLQELLQRYLDEQITGEELAELQQLVQEREHEETVSQVLQQAYANSSYVAHGDYDKDTIYAELLQQMKVAPVVPIRKRNWLRWVAAAAILLFLAGGTWVMLTGKKNVSPNGPA